MKKRIIRVNTNILCGDSDHGLNMNSHNNRRGTMTHDYDEDDDESKINDAIFEVFDEVT